MVKWVPHNTLHEFQLFSAAMFVNSGLAVGLLFCFYYLFVKLSYNAGIGVCIAVAFLVEGSILLVSLYVFFSVFFFSFYVFSSFLFSSVLFFSFLLFSSEYILIFFSSSSIFFSLLIFSTPFYSSSP
jgi:hypothetical protein